ncbi:SET and MYND domain-containing protein 4 isoform X1 [Tanacetum coccineum]|uniref:SET and MYND domain-containing protein 4 isoform X1 n=1 Tax=Tanacetum coccineum TaxID=301880 RepID=A0ABQ5ICC3_9ASTR
MGFLVESLQDCNRALAICRSYSKAWYRRGKANTSMGNYDNAVCDLKVSLCMEQSSSGKRQIEGELKLIAVQHKGKDFPPNVADSKESVANDDTVGLIYLICGLSKWSRRLKSLLLRINAFIKSSVTDQPQQIQLQCVSTETKGRGMVSLTDVPQATLLHTEEPYAAIVSKHCRETHCHFCFNELLADIVPCPSCSMALYCSQLCQIHARGQDLPYDTKNHEIGAELSSDLEKYVASVTKETVNDANIKQNAEHRHECGLNWPAALPAEIVLAGRVIVKSIEQHGKFGQSSTIVIDPDLCHNYIQLNSEAKLELHISSIVLLKCLHHCYGSNVPLNGDTISQCVLLLSQINVNSMAIIRMRSSDTFGRLNSAGSLATSTVEQVRVGQAIYLAGSMFNHSCQPNIHTYFLSRTLYIRTIDSVAARQPLELSYGPQVGQWSCSERQSSLKEQYAFVCSCTGCSQLNISDLVISSFRCSNLNCSGVVLDSHLVNHEKQKVNPFHGSLLLQVGRLELDEVKRVASLLCQSTGSEYRIEPGYCLSCGVYRDVEASNAVVKKAELGIRRLEDSTQLSTNILSNALRSLDLLRSALHPYNKKVAEVEDYMAQAFCSIGELQQAQNYCQASIKILEKLYGHDHIVIGNELVKLASIQLSLGEPAFEESRNQINLIFSQHYGSHADIIFPHLQFLKRRL